MDSLIIIAVGTLAILLTLASPYLGLQIYLGLIYLRPADLYPALAPYHITRVLAIILLISFFIRSKSIHKAKQSIPPQTIMFLGWLALILISAIPGWWPYSLELFYELSKIFIAYLLIINVANSESRLRGIIWTLLFLNTIVAWDAVQRYFDFSGALRIGGFSGAYFGNAGDLAVMINIMIPIAFLLIWSEKKIIPKLGALCCLIILIGAIVATQARAGLLTLIVSLCLLGYFGLRSYKKSFKLGSACLVFLLFVGIASFGSVAYKNRMTTILNYQDQETASERILLWKAGMKMFLQHPILGVGVWMYEDRLHEFIPGHWRQIRAHNVYISMAAELGIGGILLFLFLIYYSLRDSWSVYYNHLTRNPESWIFLMGLGLFISNIAFAFGGMFQTVLYYPPPYFIMGLSVALKRLAEREGMLSKEHLIQKRPHHARIQPLIYNIKPGHSQLDRQR